MRSADVLPLRALVLATGEATDPQTGRALRLAAALAAAGGEAHILTAVPPPGAAALATVAPGRLLLHPLGAVPDGLLGGAAEWAVVAPSPGAAPRFQADCLGLLGRAETRLALLHPATDGGPASAWEDVRRLGRLGGLVLLDGVNDTARGRHAAWAERLRFEAWRPPGDSPFAMEEAGARLADLLLRAQPVTPICRPLASGLAELALSEPGPAEPPVLPAEVLGAWEDRAGGVLVTLQAAFPAETDRLRVRDPGGRDLPALWRGAGSGEVPLAGLCHLRLPLRGEAVVTPLHRGRPCATGLHLHLRLRGAGDPGPWPTPRCTLEDERAEGDARLISGWLRAGPSPRGLLLSPDGEAWFHLPRLAQRPDLDRAVGDWAIPPLGFRLTLPAEPAPHPTRARMLLLDRGGVAYARLAGWPPRVPEGPA